MRDSGVSGKRYRKLWKEFDELKGIDQRYYYSNYFDVRVNRYSVKCGTTLRFWENNEWINYIDPYGWFHWHFRYWLSTVSSEYERQSNRWKGIVSRFNGKLVRMIKDAGGKFDDYSILTKFRHILLHWVYELTEKDLFINSKN